jgi:nickel superoxide dismutase
MVLSLLVLGSVRYADAHCEVPCGIYADEQRFLAMLEDQTTIAKAMVNINEMAGKTDALSVNQCARWVATKEAHATNTQHVIAQYFMTQRLKADNENYVKQLTAAHAVLVAAMKCKQNVDAEVAASLEKAILDFYRAYEGKEPVFHDHD